mmetsp:Transcript_4862/g.12995  ORF Transcript_4862/g.12995 Transcript_4862/m.12995 type:complete len:202 (-) Transcript_4862:246-851(-)
MATGWAAAASVRALRARGPASRRFASASGRSSSAAGGVLAVAAAPAAAALLSWSQLRAADRSEAPGGPRPARSRAHVSLAEGEEAEPSSRPPVFLQTRVWQVVAGGDIGKADDWESQDLGLDQGGNLCCIDREASAVRVCHTRDDLAKASVEVLPEGAACRPFCFCVRVPGSQPVIFAAASPAFRELWMQELARVAQGPSV